MNQDQPGGTTPSLQTDSGASADEPSRATRWCGQRRQQLKDDVIAGLTVAMVAIPQSLAYAQLAGLPAYYGLYAAFIPTIIGALFGSSPQLSTGPTAMSSLLTAASVAPLAPVGTDPFIAYVVLLSLISGLFQVLFGVMRLGVLLNFLSYPVLTGFINAAALIISMSQLPALLGLPAGQSGNLLVDIWNVLGRLSESSPATIVFGIVAIVMLAAFKRWLPRFPGVLVTIVILTTVSAVVGYATHGGSVVGAIPQGIPAPGLPSGDWASVVALLPAGFVLALISFMEAMSSAKVMAIRTRQRWNQNRELVGQGLAKIASAFSQSMPVSGSFSRSALNAGAHTNLSSVVAACAVLVTLLFFTTLLYHVPKSTLAAIIMIAVFGLIDFRAFGRIWRANRSDGIASVVTFLATLAFAPNIQNGIITGALLSLGLLLYGMMRPRVSVTSGGVTQTGETPTDTHIGKIRFDGSLQFVTCSYFEDAMIRMEQDNPELRYIVVLGDGINELDASGIETLRNLEDRFRRNGIVMTFAGLRPQVSDIMEKSGLLTQIGRENLYADEHSAVADIGRRESTATSAAPRT